MDSFILTGLHAAPAVQDADDVDDDDDGSSSSSDDDDVSGSSTA